MNERIKELRKTLEVSQRDFGKKIGITDTAVSKLENGERNPSEQTLKSICREYNVNYIWLTEGIGDMFTGVPESIIDELVVQYDLNDIETEILRKFLNLPKEQRQIMMEYLTNFFNLNNSK